MSEQIFPSWWGPKGGDPILCRNAQEIGAGWVAHRGRYDVLTGRWVPAAAQARRPSSLSGKRRAELIAIAAAEGVAHAPRAWRADLIAAIRARRAAG